MIGEFHFIRPWWLAAIIPLALLLLALRRRTSASQSWKGIVAPHLLQHLLIGEQQHRMRPGPLALIGLGWLLATIAIAGPTWRREPSPLGDTTPALAIVIKVSPSMMTEDVQPSRLARSIQKIHDLLAQRKGAKTALIAYAGSAHEVMPATTDEGIIDTFAQALDPKIMPTDGDAAADAMKLADAALKSAGGGGAILWITDGIAPEQASALTSWRNASSTPIQLLVPVLPGSERDAAEHAARVVNADAVTLTPDDSDVLAVASASKRSTAGEGNASDRWRESGYWFTPALAVLMLPFFRRGWMVPTAAK